MIQTHNFNTSFFLIISLPAHLATLPNYITSCSSRNTPKVLKKILAYEKIDSTTPREVLKKAFQFNLIDDEDLWLKILDDRNNTSHVYKQEDADRVFKHIKMYLPVFEKTYSNLKKKYNKN